MIDLAFDKEFAKLVEQVSGCGEWDMVPCGNADQGGLGVRYHDGLPHLGGGRGEGGAFPVKPATTACSEQSVSATVVAPAADVRADE